MIPAPDDVDLVIYHAGCTDGFGAAFAAWLRLGNRATYYAAKYREPPPDVAGKRVVIVDFSYPREVLLEMQAASAGIVVLDHHKTAMSDLYDLDFALFDMRQSGAMLAWRFFHPDRAPPRMIEYIQDRDLWQWRLVGSKAFSAGFMAVPFDFDAYAEFLQDSAVDALIDRGTAIVQYIDAETRLLCKHAARRRLRSAPDLKCRVVNTRTWISEVGSLICETDDVAVLWYLDHDSGAWRVSMRSRKGVDCSEIAKLFGGGGHEQAAGFSLGRRQHIEDIFED